METTTLATLFESIGPAVTGILDTAVDVVTWGLGQPLILVGFAASMISLGVGIFSAVRASV